MIMRFHKNVYINSIKLLYKIKVSEGIDIIKANSSKKCIICYYWYFLDNKFRFQPTVSMIALMYS